MTPFKLKTGLRSTRNCNIVGLTLSCGGEIASITDPRGPTRDFSYDGLHRLTEIDYPADSTYETFGYTALDLSSHRDRLGHTTQYAYNADRQLISSTDANGHATHYGYCDCGALSSITNALGEVTSLTYDNAGRRTAVTYGDGTWLDYGYNALGQRTSRKDNLGTTTCGYDDQGLLTTTTSPYGQTRAVLYDSEDRPASVTGPNGVTVTQSFDHLGRVLSRTYPDNGIEHFGYGPSGLVAYTNQLGKVWQYAYDPAGRQTNEITPKLETITNRYDAAGDMLTLTDGKDHTTTWGYDAYGHASSKKDAINTTILTYLYDADGRLTSRSSAAKGTTAYSCPEFHLDFIH